MIIVSLLVNVVRETKIEDFARGDSKKLDLIHF